MGIETSQAWMPDWYPLIRAARYLHVPPWELIKQSVAWRIWAEQAESGEIGAEKLRRKYPAT